MRFLDKLEMTMSSDVVHTLSGFHMRKLDTTGCHGHVWSMRVCNLPFQPLRRSKAGGLAEEVVRMQPSMPFPTVGAARCSHPPVSAPSGYQCKPPEARRVACERLGSDQHGAGLETSSVRDFLRMASGHPRNDRKPVIVETGNGQRDRDEPVIRNPDNGCAYLILVGATLAATSRRCGPRSCGQWPPCRIAAHQPEVDRRIPFIRIPY